MSLKNLWDQNKHLLCVKPACRSPTEALCNMQMTLCGKHDFPEKEWMNESLCEKTYVSVSRHMVN